MEACYTYPFDLISLLLASIALNVVLAISLLRRIAMSNSASKSLASIAKTLKAGGHLK